MNQNKNIYCLTPIYNDWDSFAVLIQEISNHKQDLKQYNFFVVAVNDGSTEDLPEDFDYKNIPVTVLNLKINIGHQRAIAVGLQYIYNEVSDYDFVVVMDSDGEDKPQDIKELINKAQQEKEKKIKQSGYDLIVVPMDLHKETKQKLAVVANLAKYFNSEVHVITPDETVTNPFAPYPEPPVKIRISPLA